MKILRFYGITSNRGITENMDVSVGSIDNIPGKDVLASPPFQLNCGRDISDARTPMKKQTKRLFRPSKRQNNFMKFYE